MIVETLMLQITPEEIGDDLLLFGPDSLGLDSVDALQLVVALDKKYGLKIPDAETARQTLLSPNALADAVAGHRRASAPAASGQEGPVLDSPPGQV